jgi:lauroyl/myristoyl acyltransferase
MYEIYRWAAKIVPKLPRHVRKAIAIAVGTLAWISARRQRACVAANVAQVRRLARGRFLPDWVRSQLVVRRIFCNCMQNYLDLLALPAVTRRQIVAQLNVVGAEHLEAALDQGRGAVLFSAHLGPFEYLPSWFSAQGYEMVIPVEKVTDGRLLQLMIELRRRTGVAFVPLGGTKAIRMMFDALGRNQLVLITADRVIEGESAEIDFCGAPARLPCGPVDLSLLTGAPLVGAFGWRTPGGRMAAEFTPLTLALPADQRGKREALQAAVTRQLEKVVGDHLDQWVVFEPVWKHSKSRVS